METVATVLYARLRNLLPLCNALPPEMGADFADELRNVLSGPIAKQNGVIAQQRADSVLAVFGNAPDEKPDHARRAVHGAVLAVYEAAALNRRLAARLPEGGAPPLALAAGVHLGRVDVVPGAARHSGGGRAPGRPAPGVGGSIVASEQAGRAAGERIQSGRFGSVALPDSSFVDIAEITRPHAVEQSRKPPPTYPT